MTIDHGYEERVRNVYRTKTVETSSPVEQSTSVEASLPVEEDEAVRRARMQRPIPAPAPTPAPVREDYTYEREPALYAMNDREHQNLRLYEERLITSKSRRKTGDIAVGKRVETETARVAVPVEKERVVIERRTPTDAGTVVTPGAADFHSGEVARMEVYEETANVAKQAVVREEVQIRKEVERETAEVTDTIRREELDVDVEGNPIIDRSPQRPDNLNR